MIPKNNVKIAHRSRRTNYIIFIFDFRKLFGRVGDLLNQRKTVGEVAYLEHEGRYIFYLITKKYSYAKPTLKTMSQITT